jgi:hypothetical protein
MTAAFMLGVFLPRGAGSARDDRLLKTLKNFHLEIFHDLVGEQFLAGFAQGSFRGGAILCRNLDIKYLSLPHALDPVNAKRLERALNGLALRIKNSILERDKNPRFHGKSGFVINGAA